MDSFSEALNAAATPGLAWAVEQQEVFHSTHVSDLRTDLLGTYAEDASFQWSWAKRGSPPTDVSLRLREIGEQKAIPEFTQGMVDLAHFRDPRQAAKHLAIIAMALLEARGALHYSHGGRALTFLVTHDQRVPVAAPDPSRIAPALQTAAAMFPGAGAADLVNAYARHHNLKAAQVPEGLELNLPDHQVLAHLENDRLHKVEVTGPDGPVTPAPPTPPPVTDDPIASFLPEPLFAELAPHSATALDRGSHALGEHLARLGWDQRVPPEWTAGVLRYGDLFTAEAHEIGTYLADCGTWRWGDDWDGVARLRASANAAHIAADGFALPASEIQIFIPVFLARSAVHLGKARGLARVPASNGDQRYYAVTDPRVPEPAASLDVMADVLISAAHFLQELTPERIRPATMRAMVTAYFEAYGLKPLNTGDPHTLRAMRGLHEIRVDLSRDGTLNHATHGLFPTLA
ncbi:DUF6882 domain-containing protein [Spirillospora sp. CA-294931]|uniref:DUF6882 domain-containing protein n=1 Tax=Spirillospora sp. CA-294931 TaxID=3240042 RepID=UPI003D8D8380